MLSYHILTYLFLHIIMYMHAKLQNKRKRCNYA